jgi:hypothetical protein
MVCLIVDPARCVKKASAGAAAGGDGADGCHPATPHKNPHGGFVVKPIPMPNLKPLLVFINPKSGPAYKHDFQKFSFSLDVLEEGELELSRFFIC